MSTFLGIGIPIWISINLVILFHETWESKEEKKKWDLFWFMLIIFSAKKIEIAQMNEWYKTVIVLIYSSSSSSSMILFLLLFSAIFRTDSSVSFLTNAEVSPSFFSSSSSSSSSLATFLRILRVAFLINLKGYWKKSWCYIINPIKLNLILIMIMIILIT